MNAFNIENFEKISDQKEEAEQWILVMVFAGVGILAVFYFQSYGFAIMGARLTQRIR